MIVDATASFPPAGIAYFLFDVFFDYAQTNYSYVDECSLRQKLQDFYTLTPVLGTHDAPWICTVLMMFAVGTQFAHLSSRPHEHHSVELSTGQEDAHSADDAVVLTFYHSASRLIPDVIAAASIDSVQAFLLLGVYALPIDAAGLSCTYLGIAIRIATQNGMHRRYHKYLEPRQIELRNRIWWTAFTLERRISVLHGRPVSVARSEVDSDLPTDFPELRPTTRIDTLPNVLAMIKLTDALEDARDKLLSLKKAPRKLRSTVFGSILQSKRELQQYWQSLPDATFCRDLTPDKPLFRFNVHLVLTYHLIHIFIGRSFIFNRTRASSPDTPIEQYLADWVETRNVLVAECVQSAEAVIDLCQVLHDEVGLARASYTEFTSCCAAILAVLAQRISAGPVGPANDLRLQSVCNKGIKLIKQLSVGIYSANSEKLAVEVLERALHRLDPRGHKEASESTRRSAYTQFKDWAVLQQSEPGEREQASALGHAGNLAPASHNLDVPDFSQSSLLEGTEWYGDSGCNPFELGELASVPGLDQLFEYGLL
ncbi:hypothetical protein W97_08030 [Coniosporium apollinis CBS 100218]|uniref:Xylanolytic transcriptional activator regulatory domain-containing protein n=1 Tax=Coniosporium apollinis (strain CBS 100218) TaxID=1168221 RepID=R7Z3M6_CONA1|nr:uncharacterized protein W97_08030 [Coniosporium apollinis CBS 100218]EON68772.1 hypothetical protein W97_08030 [Coniosporium apollinis CBS 100218]